MLKVGIGADRADVFELKRQDSLVKLRTCLLPAERAILRPGDQRWNVQENRGFAVRQYL
jgi:hypothetical protein